jgi:transcriptional regulator with XRE-family HTH domain
MVSMEPKGRFAMMYAGAIREKGLSLRDLAIKLDITYEQLRKIFLGESAPSKLLLKELCKILDMNYDQAEKAVTADKMERKYGKTAYTILGHNPRFSDIEDVLPMLTAQEWGMFVAQIRGYVQQKRRAEQLTP